MTFLQMHGPEPFPSFTGKLQPLDRALDPYAPGAPVVRPGSFSTFAGVCNMTKVKKEFIPQDKAGWAVELDRAADAKKLWENYKSLRQTAGTGSKPIYDSKGVITGYAPASKAEVSISYIKLGIQIGQALKKELDNAGAKRLTDDAQAVWDQNLWGIQNLCSQDLPTLLQNTQKCYDALEWWSQRQSEAQIRYKNTNALNLIERSKLDGERRIANRAVAVRQNAFRLLNEQVVNLGGNFDPNKQGQGIEVSKLIVPAILALISFR
jgi:hypothetical protein